MITSRNLTSQTYDEATAAHIASAIRDAYFAEFETLRSTLEQLRRDEQA